MGERDRERERVQVECTSLDCDDDDRVENVKYGRSVVFTRRLSLTILPFCNYFNYIRFSISTA